MAVVYGKPAQVGGYTERIAPGALDGVNLDDITLLVNHNGAGIPLARSPKTMTLTVTEEGLAMRAELPDTEAGRGVYEAVLDPLALQMSLEFSRRCGAEVTFTSERLEFSSARTRISLLRELLPFGVVSINEARRLLALPEVEGGDRRLQSLNYVTADKADTYQLEDENGETQLSS
jgi:phage head maturation protease